MHCNCTTNSHCLYCTAVYLFRCVCQQSTLQVRKKNRNAFPDAFHDEQLNTCDARKLSHNFCQWITLPHKKGKTTKLCARSQTQQFVFARDCLRHQSTAFHPNYDLPHSALRLQIPSERPVHSSLRSAVTRPRAGQRRVWGSTTDTLTELSFVKKKHFGSDVQPASYSSYNTGGKTARA